MLCAWEEALDLGWALTWGPEELLRVSPPSCPTPEGGRATETGKGSMDRGHSTEPRPPCGG